MFVKNLFNRTFHMSAVRRACAACFVRRSACDRLCVYAHGVHDVNDVHVCCVHTYVRSHVRGTVRTDTSYRPEVVGKLV